MPVLVKSECVLPSSLSSSVALPDDSLCWYCQVCLVLSTVFLRDMRQKWAYLSCLVLLDWREQKTFRLPYSDRPQCHGHNAICCCVVTPVPNLSYLYFNAIHKSHLIAYYIISKTYICAYNRRAGKIISNQYCLGQKYGILFGNHHRTFFIT